MKTQYNIKEINYTSIANCTRLMILFQKVYLKVGSVPFSVSAAISTKPVNFGYRCKVS